MPKHYIDTVTGVEFEGVFELTPPEKITLDQLRKESKGKLISVLQDCKYDISTARILGQILGVPPLQIRDWAEVEKIVETAVPGDIVYFFDADDNLYRTTLIRHLREEERGKFTETASDFFSKNPEIGGAFEAIARLKENKEESN